MSFRSPWMLVALVVLPGIVAAYVTTRRRRSRRATVLASEGLVTTPFAGRAGWTRHLPFALFSTALAVLVLAMARPSMSVRTPRREATVVLAIDVSNSMAADDAKPTRFDVEKTVARAFVERQPSAVRIGVVAFGVGAVTVQEPTTAHGDVVAAIQRLSLGGGTALGQGLISSLGVIAGKPITIDESALQSDAGKVDIGYFGGATIVLFSDGENLSNPDPVAVASVASVAGVHVHSVGIGTEDGAVVQVDGFSVATALDSDLLKKVASATDGTYHQATDTTGTAEISKTIDLHFKVVSKHTEVTGLFSAAGALLLVAGALLSILWFGRVV